MKEMEKFIVRVVAAELEREGKFLITQRRETSILPLLWEFPSGKVEPGESDEEALVRELEERLAVKTQVETLSMFIRHEYEDYLLDFFVYRCRLLSSPDAIVARQVRTWRWVSTEEMDQYEFPPADARTIRLLLERGGEEGAETP